MTFDATTALLPKTWCFLAGMPDAVAECWVRDFPEEARRLHRGYAEHVQIDPGESYVDSWRPHPICLAMNMAPDLVEPLLRAGVSPDEARARHLEPLRVAVQIAPQYLALLMRYGAYGLRVMSGSGTPLMEAVRHFPQHLPQALAAGLPQGDEVDGWEGMSLMIAAVRYQPEVIPTLVAAGIPVQPHRFPRHADEWGGGVMYTPLMTAALHQPRAIPLLLAAGADVQLTADPRHTPLRVAVFNNPPAVPLLLAAGAADPPGELEALLSDAEAAAQGSAGVPAHARASVCAGTSLAMLRAWQSQQSLKQAVTDAPGKRPRTRL